MKRKVNLRESFQRKLREEGQRFIWKRNGKLKRKRGLKKIGRAQRHRLQKYFALTAEFLKQDENQNCGVCVKLRERGENIVLERATEVHHIRGRAGALLYDQRFWLPCCFHHRTWPHDHPKTARELGLLAPAALWNVVEP